MSTLRRAMGNGAIMLVSQAITWTATLIVTAALGWYLGAARFGDLYLAISLGTIFSVLVEFGLNQQIVRAVARDETLAGSYLANSLAIKGAFGLVAYGLMLALAWLLGYSGELRLTIAIYALTLFCNGAVTSFTAIYQARQRVVYSALGTIVEKTLVCAVALALLFGGYGVIAVAATYVLGAAANALLQGCCLTRIGVRPIPPAREVMAALVRGALPFFAYWVLGAVYYRVDTILLSKLADAATVGWYGAAYRLFDTLVFLPNIVASAIMFPILAQLSVQSRPALQRAMGKGLEIMLILGLPLCVGLCVLAEPIIGFIYRKPEFMAAAPALQWLAVALFLLYLNAMLAVTLVSLNEERKLTLVAGVAVAFNLTLNWWLIPHYGHVAAAAVTAATEGILLVSFLAMMARDLLPSSTILVGAKAALAAGAMALVLVLLRGLPLPLLVAIGGAVYCAVGLAVRLVAPDDLRLVRRAVLERKRGAVLEAEVAGT